MRSAFTKTEIRAVAFDIDGTLYPDFRLYWRLPAYFLKNLRFFLAFQRVRKRLHTENGILPPYAGTAEEQPGAAFRRRQAELLGAELGIPPAEAAEKISAVVYEGLKPFFRRIKPYAGTAEVFSALREAGFKLGILSDFPPAQKGSVWGLAPMCHAVLSSEETGALKPAAQPFRALAGALQVPPAEILYVGNSLRSDILGAKAAGMKTALILHPAAVLQRKKKQACDIYFYSYRQFLRDVVNCG
ncbi:MAG: HAD family hydrolase [Spirochaetes bacterium]|uniref:HAD family hydrolase n=1 Tax=Candidatus Avitreponema avistercoris TaxID=2840705 RepID=A0A9D9ENR6_9SPIR|nr:HAD family hydrolase [Candidatus Avitreponema avistercoris]